MSARSCLLLKLNKDSPNPGASLLCITEVNSLTCNLSDIQYEKEVKLILSGLLRCAPCS